MDIPRPEYPRPQLRRDSWKNLNGTWTFTFDPGNSGTERGLAESKGFGEKILVPFCPESKLSGVGYTDFIETMWYHREASLPDSWRGKRILIHFGGVDFSCDLFVNGRPAGSHWGGSSAFAFDITDLVNFGSGNHLVLRVRDLLRTMTQPAGKQRPEYELRELRAHYTRTTGIWSTVWLEAVAGFAIKQLHIVPDFEAGRFILTPTFYSWGAAVASDTRLRVSVAADAEEALSVESSAADGIPTVLDLTDPRPWHPDDPFLYDINLAVLDGSGREIDRVESYAGLRSVRIDGAKVLLNGKPLYQRLVLDQGFYPDGLWTAPSEEELRKDIELSLQAGFNGARLHQKVFDAQYHYWADRLGYLTWAEAPSWGMASQKIESARNFLAEWRAMVVSRRNHPSIIAWTPLNETRDVEPDSAQHHRFHEDLYDLTKSLDPTRPVNDVSGYVHVKTDLWTSHSYQQDPAKLARSLEQGSGGEVFRNFPHWEAPYRGQPYLVDEFGGILWVPQERRNPAAKGVWGYGEGPKSIEEYYARLEGLVDAILAQDYICGYCYTQLTDVEQEQNGIYTYDRSRKFDMERIRAIFKRQPSR